MRNAERSDTVAGRKGEAPNTRKEQGRLPKDEIIVGDATGRMTIAERLSFAQNFFRFAYLVGSPISYGLPVALPDPPEVIVFGCHSLVQDDLELPKEEFERCGAFLERLAYRLLALELNTGLEEKFGSLNNRETCSDDLIRNSSIVVWIIRNAVAHNIFQPIWRIDDPKYQDKKFVISDLPTFDTTGLNGKHLRRLDFGGPIALFRLSEKLLPRLS